LGIDPGLMSLYYKFFYKPKAASIESIIDQRAKGIDPFHFVQIGGNDGFIQDPIFKFIKKYPWKGIIVEPQKDVFNNKLRRTYRLEKKVVLENIAIASSSGTKKLYKLTISDSRWATGLATFDRKVLEYQIRRNYVDQRAKREGIQKGTYGNLEDYITFEEVKCMTLSDLLVKHKLSHLDLLQIDTEGYDFEIIKTINFSSLKPSMISFESEHLSIEDAAGCITLLTNNGYKIMQQGRDTIAYLEA
jgi:FkbM family methyltransferase